MEVNFFPQKSQSLLVTRKRTRAQFKEDSQKLIKKVKPQTTSSTKIRPRPLIIRVKSKYEEENKQSSSVQNKETNTKAKSTRQSNLVEFFQRKKCKNSECKQDLQDAQILCEICNDSYHWQCTGQFKQPPSNTEEFICKTCSAVVREGKKLRQQNQYDLVIECFECKSDLSEDTRKCVKCTNQFHSKCFNRKESSPLCSKCLEIYELEGEEVFPKIAIADSLVQSPLISVKSSKNMRNLQLTNFFKQSKNASSTYNIVAYTPTQSQIYGEIYSQDMIKKPQRKKSLSQTRKKNIFKLPKLTDDPILEQEIRNSIRLGLFAKGMKYTHQQVFDDPKCPQSMNNPELERNIQKMIKENQQVIYELRKREQLGILPPVLIKYDPAQGFYVEAAQDMSDLTLICEYAGEVRTFRQCLFDKNDSIMELLDTGDSDTSLNIVPQKQANVGRFFNSINNSSKDSKKKQNIRSLRCQIDGKVTVLIFTKRPVKKGESLLYNYNEAKNLYPTEDFI
ncbi:histone-lysine n-methyltransferase atxr6-like [Stylonychia lemnae]|uniref:Histone-lysine n-methyltransferase atxr6-like n=1 Tax=Stylonychia lemnae TaxID=5949 RepID=A0A078B928_STYLE|nr:histone-lysine n-methyltransferase atxr6-like [Stylonychia lemnae]|eukprot:CDW89782.1 histone-lysine n-methyltransferase atxr6-like [Stylonychia lemnae]